ncbi:MAG: 4-(cytidine 5'-diphospho)-2-C-methyl-D-erythritol kinase [Thermomicrobiales bacterium]
MRQPSAVQVDAPAKINLGLELLGKQPDGYHEIRTVMAMIDLADQLLVQRTRDSDHACVTGVDLGDERNLVSVAYDTYATETRFEGGIEVNLTKHIPIAGGLGGASSNAAATLLCIDALTPLEQRLGRPTLMTVAASIGSDVPFFLGTPIAMATGTGTTLSPLPVLPKQQYTVLVSPAIALPRKTATLYRAIVPSDFTDGTRTDALANLIASGAALVFDAEVLANPFRTAWTRLGDPIAAVERALIQAGAFWVALSGAGPTVYTLTDDRDRADSIATRLRTILTGNVAVNVAPLRARGMEAVPLAGMHP